MTGKGRGRKMLPVEIDGSVFRTQRFADEAADIIRHLILSGHFEWGERLNELNLAETLKISRSPIREALQALAGEGLVRMVPGRGAYVTSFDLTTVHQLGDVRMALECAGARLAAERASDDQLASLGELLTRTEAALADMQHPYPRDLDFHQSVLEITGNPNLVRAAREINVQLQLARTRSGEVPGRARKAYAEHKAICEALQRRDPEAAEAAMREHLTRSMDNIEHLFRDEEQAATSQDGVA